MVAVITVGSIALLFPLLARQRDRSRRMQCEWNLTRLAAAVNEFETAELHYPGYRNEAGSGSNARGETTSWVVPLMPWLEGGLASRADKQKPAAGHVPPAARLSELVCPADARFARQPAVAGVSYVANSGLPDVVPTADWPADYDTNGIFFDRSKKSETLFPVSENDARFVQNHDGLSETVMLSENIDAGTWTEDAEPRIGMVWRYVPSGGPYDEAYIGVPLGVGDPRYANYHQARPSSGHVNGVNVSFCDGHVTFTEKTIDLRVFAEMMCTDWRHARWPGTKEAVFSAATR